ncbi:XdhC family protein [Tritonibacter horizontis]|uniref:XdhC and CoxI family protein n=1 Tax=Tritonibacter horizontis TaxID=1768241 RepID=A0A132C2P3_9RHOB|nr:XdhC family protein [Tritonibacter horizontis]KUP94851.1 XdhC and CoxI family protein [Tritonibacter horizontis]
MTLIENLPMDLAEAAKSLRAQGEAFAFATIVRTAGATAAKPGAKALLDQEGSIVHGWLGGGCTRAAVKRAAVEAFKSGKPQLVSIAPEELLAEKGVMAGDEVDGTLFARNGCPSRGSIDIFIEPCLPMPMLAVIGSSPVARALSSLAPNFQWDVTGAIHQRVSHQHHAIVVATQGQGDLDALTAALNSKPDFVAFVGSQKKFAVLAGRLRDAGVLEEAIASVKAPAGLDIGAITPEEIALSILAELVLQRRSFLSERVND